MELENFCGAGVRFSSNVTEFRERARTPAVRIRDHPEAMSKDAFKRYLTGRM